MSNHDTATEKPPLVHGERDDLAALDFSHPADRPDDNPSVQVFTVTNPPGTVAVTVFMDGRVKRIELSSRVTEMTEQELADEIVVIAGLATQEAKSAQYMFMLDGMREQGHDDAATRDFLTRDLDLPTPEEARTARAHIFATRYSGDHV
ncbi:YbaB/EbfC family DNA-binding protein [Mycobacterium barrassiae]|uniref:YbaB/EbfC family DNA-binding protein n=1 Tax=Mycobacterium barrassiae TaxID=319709 RepID=UPI0035564151|nr:YbaB/EbfC family DNA-binding protein [Mycobacterium barrassiae]